MSKGKSSKAVPWSIEANRAYQCAEENWRRGRLRPAFRFFLAAANAGVIPAFGTVAQFYDCGFGTKRNKNAALYWYRRAYRHGDHSAANNIGCIWQDRNQPDRALLWFHRAAKLGDADAYLNIARVYLRKKQGSENATHYLKKVRRAPHATMGSKEEAGILLRKLRNKKMSRARSTDSEIGDSRRR